MEESLNLDHNWWPPPEFACWPKGAYLYILIVYHVLSLLLLPGLGWMTHTSRITVAYFFQAWPLVKQQTLILHAWHQTYLCHRNVHLRHRYIINIFFGCELCTTTAKANFLCHPNDRKLNTRHPRHAEGGSDAIELPRPTSDDFYCLPEPTLKMVKWWQRRRHRRDSRVIVISAK